MSKENVSVRLEADQLSKVESIAAILDRDRSAVISEAVNAYIDFFQWQMDEIDRAVAEADAGDFATPEEIAAVDAKYRP